MMLRRGNFTFALLILWVTCLALGGGGCGCDDSRAAKPQATREPARVLGTTYAMAAVAKAVGGDRVQTAWWVESGQSLAELVETPERRLQLTRVDLIITRGQVDPWTLLGSGNPFQDQRILRIDTLPAARDLDPGSYLWLDPQVGRELAEELVVRLGARDPAHAALFRANADQLLLEMASLIEPVRSTVNRIGGGPFVTLDPGFDPLGRRFELDEVKIAMVDLRAPTAFNVRQLRQSIENAQGGAVFANAETPSALLRDWEARLGYPVLELEPFGSSAQTGRSTYAQIMRYNLKQLEKGVSLAKPRERAGPGPMGAVTYETSDLPPPPPDLAALDAAATRPATKPAENEPATPRVAPMERPSLERLKLNLPKPTTQELAPASRIKTAPRINE